MTTTVLNTPMVGFDVETTGLDKVTERIVTASLVTENGSRNWLVNPEYRIDEGASRVHGITDEKAQKDGQDARTALEEIISALAEHSQQGHVIVGYNVIYDFTILEYEAKRHGLTPLSQRASLDTVMDPFILDKALNTYRSGKRTLEKLTEIYGIPLDNAHEAWADAQAAVQLFRALVQQSVEEGKSVDVEPQKLHNWHVVWKRRQDMSFADYLRTRPINRVDNPDVPSGWPIEDRAKGTPEEDYSSFD